jgi:hypothetical protein
VNHFVDVFHSPARGGERFFLGALTIVLGVEVVVGVHVDCCPIWTAWRQAVSVISSLVYLINFSIDKICIPTIKILGV